MNLEDKKRTLGSIKNLGIAHLAIRIIKFIIGVSGLFAFSIPAYHIKSAFEIGAGLIAVFTVWLLLTIVSRILLIIYIVKISSLADVLGIKDNPVILSKLSTKKTLSITGFFISYLDVIAVIMFLSLNSRYQKELLNSDEKIRIL